MNFDRVLCRKCFRSLLIESMVFDRTIAKRLLCLFDYWINLFRSLNQYLLARLLHDGIRILSKCFHWSFSLLNILNCLNWLIGLSLNQQISVSSLILFKRISIRLCLLLSLALRDLSQLIWVYLLKRHSSLLLLFHFLFDCLAQLLTWGRLKEIKLKCKMACFRCNAFVVNDSLS